MNTNPVLGIDCSTQSLSAILIDPAEGLIIRDFSIPWRVDPRVNRFGIDFDSLIIPPRVPGEADQPPLMFLAALDALFEDMAKSGNPIPNIAAIALSAQQHGHVYLSDNADKSFKQLQHGNGNLVSIFKDSFSYRTAPIWQTSDTVREADEIRQRAGGVKAVVSESGSNSPLRFSGAIIRRIARQHPAIYTNTARIHLLSSFLSGILSGNAECPIDWGNGSGMSLMNYKKREWSDLLLDAVAGDMPGGSFALKSKLPVLANPITIAGNVAPYFVQRYGFDPECKVTIGSGDNPHTKNLIKGDLLSLGTSFVYMVDTGKPVVDIQGYANSMYDGLGRPFVFACRTNGAMVWDKIMSIYGTPNEYIRASTSLATTKPGSTIALWHPFPESYPESPALPHREIECGQGRFEQWYPAVTDSSLVLTWYYANGFDSRYVSGGGSNDSSALAITGGPASDIEILKRVAAIWRRPVVSVGKTGAALGAALSAQVALGYEEGELDDLRLKLLPMKQFIEPDPGMVEAFHGKEGAVKRIVDNFILCIDNNS